MHEFGWVGVGHSGRGGAGSLGDCPPDSDLRFRRTSPDDLRFDPADVLADDLRQDKTNKND